jgi:benzoate 4-monooxygenase
MCNQVVHHDVSAWGNDALSFRPERWLEAGNSLSSNDLLPFGSGHRQCIGKNIAMISIVKVLTVVWRRYKLEAVDPDEPLVVESVGIGEKKEPFLVRARLS